MVRNEKILSPTSLILLGASGDLSKKKLLPSLMDLYVKGVLPDYFHILAFSRNNITTEEYRAFAREHITAKNKNYSTELIEGFLSKIEYTQGVFEDPKAYERVRDKLESYDTSIGMCSSKLFYLAVPPVFYDTIFEQLSAVKLEQPCLIGNGWTRVLVEKPFGHDLDHAKRLDEKLSTLFKEEQIYRIDHYLAKDALQNIIAFRFSNVLFEDKWNNTFIDAVCIKVHESIDVADRGAFFDGIGALRDVGQNHMLQMLALVAMDHPEVLEANAVRTKRAEILESLHIPDSKERGTTIIKGQYNGFRETKNVNPESKTETYFALKTFLNNERWKGVPFYLEHGKALKESKTEITVRFRPSKNCVCNEEKEHYHPNFVRFTISPEQKITLRFWVRKPGLKYELESKDLVFDRHDATEEDKKIMINAYEAVLFDAICGDQTLFVSNREQEASWKYITAILRMWEADTPIQYEQGTNGPSSPLIEEIKKSGHLFK